MESFSNDFYENLLTEYLSEDNKGKIKVLCGNYVSAVSSFLKSNLPFSKGAIISLNKTYADLGNPLENALKKDGTDVLSVLFSKKSDYSIEDVSDLYNLPEDIRFLIVFDEKLFSVAKYYAYSKNIPVILIPFDFGFFDMLSPVINVKNGDVQDNVKVDLNLFVIIDEQIVAKKEYKGYSFVMGKLSSLFDYRFIGAVKDMKGLNKDSYDLIKSSVQECFYALSVTEEKRKTLLIESAFKTELANYISNGDFYAYSSAYAGKRLLELTGKSVEDAEFIISLKLLSLYKIFCGADELLKFPDYNKRAEYLSKKTKLKKSFVLEGILSQLKSIKSKKPHILALKKALKNESESIAGNIGKLYADYYSLGGKTERDFNGVSFAVKYCGDLFFNFVSEIREFGITELIDD